MIVDFYIVWYCIDMNKRRRDAIAACDISKTATYSLGGYPQKVLIEGRSEKNPIVIFLHGGPGSPIPFSVGSRGLFPEYTECCTLVFWDQLGCGINRFPIGDSFTTEVFADMTADLVRAIREEYPDHPVNLFGVSYGSVLAAKTAAKIPELLDHVVVYGQIIKNLSFNEVTFSALEKSSMPAKSKHRLSLLRERETHTTEDIMKMVTWVKKYTEGYRSKTAEGTPLAPVFWGLLTSPDYSLKDFKAVFINEYSKSADLFQELLRLDLTDTLENISIPYLIMQGSKDIVTPTEIVSAFMSENRNENLSFSIIEDCGHMPSAAGMKEILKQLVEFVK